MLDNWKTPPGTQEGETFNDKQFNKWLEKAKDISTESGHLEIALITIGHVLIYTPPDTNGLWICRTIAAALNTREADGMRRGFSTGILNSRGVHWVDPSGKAERDLADQYRTKASELEDAGFQRFAATLRGLAEHYDREAERIIDSIES